MTTQKILIIDAYYYDEVSTNLLDGINSALSGEFKDLNLNPDYIVVAGALEIPQAINLVLKKVHYDGIIALGCVIRGETSHYDIVADNSARGIMELSFKYNIPITNAILTVDNYDQAIVRSKDRGQHALKALIGLMNIGA
jgi:6,7-dimethyl-8-ribityllumazine synthase|tara:strand:- start:43 stop:462 length:420 start_codon:yes stop_codon:yes gene_type:complete